MQRGIIPAALLSLLVLPSFVHAQQQSAVQQCRLGGASAAVVLEREADLGLSADQLRRVRQIHERQQKQNAPLLKQLEEAGVPAPGQGVGAGQGPGAGQGVGAGRGAGQGETARRRDGSGAGRGPGARAGGRGPGQGAGMTEEARARRERVRPVFEQVRANNQEACTALQAALTDAQVSRLLELEGRQGSGPRR
ncbi:MAG TPA: hypothetical protein VK936_15535 [Longimicrobiales bacterium]|nr:hypothetical protein [Longimicrobiales bacterium]